MGADGSRSTPLKNDLIVLGITRFDPGIPGHGACRPTKRSLRYVHMIINPIEAESLPDLARGKGRSVDQRTVVTGNGIIRITFSGPPADGSGQWQWGNGAQRAFRRRRSNGLEGERVAIGILSHQRHGNRRILRRGDALALSCRAGVVDGLNLGP